MSANPFQNLLVDRKSSTAGKVTVTPIIIIIVNKIETCKAVLIFKENTFDVFIKL
jgi:hypothetical protein